MLERCEKCGKKQFNPSSRRCYACGMNKRKDGTFVFVPEGYFLDSEDNIRTPNHSKIENGKLIVSYEYLLEEGKTTLRGEHRKLREGLYCQHPERLSCNYGTGFERCPFMKYNREGDYWYCDTNK